ncbi:hypothetical protein SCFA_190056 [anaerobic digester metagenome]|uniref:Uncharacterized protein n=1 Tax=anaerobic digester metagenome TaxID=1263854 RepID=A0A485LY59_9ZZZZ
MIHCPGSFTDIFQTNIYLTTSS